MSYSITTRLINAEGEILPELYARASANNPTIIDESEGEVTLNFTSDGTFYQLPANLKVKVTGATKKSWTRENNNKDGTLVIANPTSDVEVTITTSPRVKALNVGPFVSGNQTPIDARIVLDKAQMPLINDEEQPDYYFCVCRDDNKIYIYQKTNEIDAELGKFRSLEDYLNFSSSEAAKDSIAQAINNTLNESETVQQTVKEKVDVEIKRIVIDGGEIK